MAEKFARWLFNTVLYGFILTVAWIIIILCLPGQAPWVFDTTGFTILFALGLLFGGFIADPLHPDERQAKNMDLWLANTQGFTREQVYEYAHVLRENELRTLAFYHAEGAETLAAIYSNLRAHFEALERRL